MRTIGEWNRKGKGKYIKQVQTQIGAVLAAEVVSHAKRRGVSQSQVLREVWDWVLKSDLEIGMAGLVRDRSGDPCVTGVSVTQEMYDAIEEARGCISRGTFLRAITAAGLKREGV